MPTLRPLLTHLTAATVALCIPACADDDPSVCDEDQTATRANPSTDFTALSTFAILPESDFPDELPSDLPDDAQLSVQSANEAARQQLIGLGLTEADLMTGDPDVVLFTVAATEDQTGVIWECVPGYYWWGWWGYAWDPCAWLAPIPVDYSVGTLVLGLATPADEAVVFGGTLQGVLECGDVASRVDAGVARIFTEYPADQTGN